MGENLIDQLLADASMNEEIPVKTHLHATAALEREAAAALASATAEIERLRADKERLDWMEANFDYNAPNLNRASRNEWDVQDWNGHDWKTRLTVPTLREAIDAARKESP